MIFINDIADAISPTNHLVYADDIKTYRAIYSAEDELVIQRTINNIIQWTTTNRLMVNQSKTYHMRYGSQINRPTYYIAVTPIINKTYIRDLGVIYDQDMKFDIHINTIISKCNKMIGASWRLSKELNNPIMMIKLYNTYIRPTIEYCSSAWITTRVLSTQKLLKIQKKITRIALRNPRPGAPNYLTFEERLNLLKEISADKRLEYLTCALIIKIIKGSCDSPLQDTLVSFINKPSTTRNPNVFTNYRENCPKKSPLFIAMDLINKYRNNLNINILTTNQCINILKQNVYYIN